MIVTDAREVANAILSIAEDAGIRVSNLALNKILFFAHGWHLAIHDPPLVDLPFEAWQFGPVHPQIYRQLKRLGHKAFPRGQRLTQIDLETGVTGRSRQIWPPVNSSFAARLYSSMAGIQHLASLKSRMRRALRGIRCGNEQVGRHCLEWSYLTKSPNSTTVTNRGIDRRR